ncbi:MAG TPA: alpha/beta fold hydrolase [Blastocatellia bacterium]|nr:alpha/beta fold hydrolase [Blastocatellia bacterium]
MRIKPKLFVGVVIILPFIVGALIWLAGTVLSHSAYRTIGALPPDVQGRAVTFPSASGATIHGWWIAGQPHKGAVLLMHGVRDSRLSMLDRARFLSAAGHSVLLFDFQAHGESQGEQITFGYLESRDAQAAVQFVREALPGEKIGIIGVSLGGAATLLAEPKIEVNAIAVEMVYPTIQQAIDNRMRHYLSFVGGWLTPLFVVQLEPRLGIAPEALQPINKIGTLTMPKLIVAASEDRHTPLTESRALFDAAQEPKELWVVEGAAHENLHRFAKEEYERRVLHFFDQTLR